MGKTNTHKKMSEIISTQCYEEDKTEPCGRERRGTFQTARTVSTYSLSWKHGGRTERKQVWPKNSKPGEGWRQIGIWSV